MWGAITSNVGQRAPATDGNGGQNEEDGGQNKEEGRVGAVGMIGAVAVRTPVVTGLIGVGGRIGGVLGAAMPTRGVLGAAMARGMPGAAMTLTTGGVPGTAMTTGGVPGAIDDNQAAVAGLLGWPIVTINPRSRGCLAGQS